LEVETRELVFVAHEQREEREHLVRLDKWLWAARFYKTRALATEAIGGGKVHVNGERARASKVVQLGLELSISQGGVERVVVVKGLSARRGPAGLAGQMFEEKEESVARREAFKELRNQDLTAPTLDDHRNKRGRRYLRRLKTDR